MSTDTPLLRLDGCHVRYGMIPALRGVSLEVMPREMVAILGANGAGKSTTLRTISGLIKPWGGSITFRGERIDGLSAPAVVSRGIAQMPEGRDLFPGLTVRENLQFGYFPQLKRDPHGLRAALEYVYNAFPKLRARRGQKAGTLSGGEQQMLTAGMALVARPELLLVDELSLGLAPLIVDQLFEVLRDVNATLGTAVLLVEQTIPRALANTSRAYVLSKGEVAMAGSSRDLENDPDLQAAYLGGRLGEKHVALQERVAEPRPSP